MSQSNAGHQSLRRPETTQPGHLHRQVVLNPITALAFFTALDGQLYLLAGEDNQIKVYHVESSKCCGGLPIFAAQCIHGIAVPERDGESRDILVWGGHTVTVLRRRAVEALISGHAGEATAGLCAVEARAPDWIFDGVLSPYEDGGVVLLTAHNEVVEAQFDERRGTVNFGKTTSPSRPNLYSGRLSWDAREEVLVASGTVFGEILVWKCFAGRHQREADYEILFVFSGHEGSIFGVDISPPVRLENGDCLRLLASCSDDRTIRVWDITEKRGALEPSRRAFDDVTSAARETGFGDSVEAAAKNTDSARCLAAAMGHASRIWRVGFAQQSDVTRKGGAVLWSFGEDATAQQWELTVDSKLPPTDSGRYGLLPGAPTKAQLTHRATVSGHSGKHIWSHAMVRSVAGLQIATGGSDGKILLIHHSPKFAMTELSTGLLPPLAENRDSSPPLCPIAAPLDTDCHQVSSTEQGQGDKDPAALADAPKAPFKKSKGKKARQVKEIFQRYKFVSDDRILAVTSFGRVFIGACESEISWQEVTLPQGARLALLSYSVIERANAGSVAFLGTAAGDVLIYHDRPHPTVEYLTRVHGKVADMFCLSSSGAVENGQPGSRHGPQKESGKDLSHLLLVTVLGSTRVSLLHLQPSMGADQPAQTEIELPGDFVATSAALCGQMLVIGSRHGFILVLTRSAEGAYVSATITEAAKDEAVTSILPLPRDAEDAPQYFIATSRDGKYRVYSIRRHRGGVEMELLNETSPPFGPLLEEAWLSTNADGSRDLMICGFRSKNFILWNETQGREIASVECGGGHRIFAHTSLEGHADGLRLVYTKASELSFFSQTSGPSRTLKTGGHGREIRAISYAGKYVATASEDTRIRIWSYDPRRAADDDGGMRCLTVIGKHTSGIQKLQWGPRGYLFSSGGNEEFFAWRCSDLRSDCKGLAVVCEAVFPDRSEVGDLRIVDFAVECEEPSESEPLFYITMVLSNSTMQSYTYAKSAGFRLRARGVYTGACLTQVLHLQPPGRQPWKPGAPVLTAATDGHVVVWTTTGGSFPATPAEAPGQATMTYESTVVAKLHQSSIKTLESWFVGGPDGGGEGSVIVATGGDDNALGLLHLRLRLLHPQHQDDSSQDQQGQGQGHWEVAARLRVRSAHAAAITGLAILSVVDESTATTTAGGDAGWAVTVVSTGNDQRVKTWRFRAVGGGGGGGRSGAAAMGPRACLLDDRYSSVADAGDMEKLDRRRVMVGGVGMEIWDVDADEEEEVG